MKKILIIFLAICAFQTRIAYSQKDCFSMENYPMIDWTSIHDSAGMNEAVTLNQQATIDYFNSMINCPMPFINAVSIDGDTLSNIRLKGKVVVINFWFMECKPCVEEIPYLTDIKNNFKDQDVVFIGITRDKKEDILSFIEKKGFSYTMIADGLEISFGFALNGWPHTYIFDKEGRFKAIFTSIRNEYDRIQIETKIRELL